MSKRRGPRKTPDQNLQRNKVTSPTTQARSRLLTNKLVNVDVVTTNDPNQGRIQRLRHTVHEAIANNPVVRTYRKTNRTINKFTSPQIQATLAAKRFI